LDFLHLLQRVDLNSLLLNGVLFADGRNMVSFLETQLRHPESFWNKQDPSSSYVIIASSDSYVVAMSLADGTVWAWLRDEGPQGRKCVATTPELLLRGLGMLQVEQDITREELGDLVRAVGSNEGAGFWSDLFEGFR